ncbi:MAG: hypothetical protein CENE_02264 [Candidatus Celerinatantimonas neptuna]|nr:MAG: hypothetical protein CENE_02264 [Candidatus Celerinatantimonas neptuna]
MRIASIYDIHANPFALDAVIQDIKTHHVDLIVVGGDVIAGPLPGKTLAQLQQLAVPAQFILGNAENECLRYLSGKPIGELSSHSELVTRWVAAQLSDADQQWIRQWLTTWSIQTDPLGTLLFCHATPKSDTEIVTRLTCDEKIAAQLVEPPASVIICGHTHMPFERTVCTTRWINSGSVGMPFGKAGADWLLIDNGIHFMHTDYDTNHAALAMQHTDYPDIQAFIEHNILSVPSENEALQFLEKISAKSIEIQS